jgi:hypothetical protein
MLRSALFIFLLATLSSCASDLAVEEAGTASYPAVTGQGAKTEAFPIRPEVDTTPPPPGSPAPTPYGMTIREPAPDLQAKGATEDSAPALAAQRLLTGRWINTEEPLEQVAFTPTHYQTYFDGEMLVEEDMQFYGTCPDACSGGTSTGAPCFTISGPAQTDCYHIVRLSPDVLELQLLGVSSETIVYRKADQ